MAKVIGSGGRTNTLLAGALFSVLFFCIVYLSQQSWNLFRSARIAQSATNADRLLAAAPLLDVVAGHLLAGVGLDLVGQPLGRTGDFAKVVLFGRDTCQRCDAAWNVWAAALSAPQAAPIEIWYVSFQGFVPPAPVKNMIDLAGSAKVMHVQSAEMFAVKTGIDVLPVVYVVAPRGDVACIVAGTPTTPNILDCLSRVHSKELGTKFFTYGKSLESAFGSPAR